MKVIIFGARGFIGKYLLDKISKLEEFEIIAITGQKKHNNSNNIQWKTCDVLDERSVFDVVCEKSIVINLIYMSSEGAQKNLKCIKNILNACDQKNVVKLIHCSTAVIAGRVPNNVITEKTKINPYNNYEKIKYEIEEMIINDIKLNNGAEKIIIRPTAVFGLGGKNIIKLLNDSIFGNKFLNYFKSILYGERRFNLVSVYNVISSIIFLIKQTKNLNGEAFIISDDSDEKNNFNYVESKIYESYNLKKLLHARIYCPKIILRILLTLLNQSNTNPDRIYSSEKLVQLGWKPVIGFDMALNDFFNEYKSRINENIKC